jgi:DNA-directed RNA polymerase specialized sigma24 family protein
MQPADPQSTVLQRASAQFQPTHWSMVLQAADQAAPGSEIALNAFCQIYWFPIYAFVRSKGNDCHHSNDLTQGFFVHLLQMDLLKQAGPGRGRFRSFLLACLTNFMRDEWRKSAASKRGGDALVFSIEESEAEERYGDLPLQEADSIKKFDRAWAETVVKAAKRSLKESYAAKHKENLFANLEHCLTGELAPDSYAKVAAVLNMSRETLHTNISRFRREFGKCLRNEVAKIVASPAEIDDEIRYLISSWAGHLEQEPKTT